ncbi:hypothetical protein F8A10_07640 [Paracoccus kondratievae]|uniref:hypothetical protein n=1 Tax=Paracoccus kondratievae TaxID=135740 RepID=UPI0012665026|nr:hypothetical protein [Paracoccus kondratievae]QFQ87305.1 hypothetical protein F8A10_07640 [Paracoccus kondratievae]
MIYVAQISDGIVTVVTVQPADYEPEQGQVVVGHDNLVGIGWSYLDGQFVAPVTGDGDPEDDG